MIKKITVFAFIIFALFALSACSNLADDQYKSGDLALSIADKPVNNVEKVLVTIEKVQVKKEDEDGWNTINDFEDEEEGEKEFDLMKLRFDEELLGQETLETGFYEQIRLIVAEDEENTDPKTKGKSRVVYKDNTEDDPIFIPSGIQTGLKIDHNFEIREDTITRLLLDVDVSEIMHQTGNEENNGKIILRPTAIDIIDQVVSGSILGRVAKEVDGEKIYDFNYDVIVEAYNNDDELVRSTVALAEDTEEKDAGSFLLRGLEAGTYKLKAYTVEQVDEKMVKGDLAGTLEGVLVEKEKVTELEENENIILK